MPAGNEELRGHLKHLILNQPTATNSSIAEQAGCSFKAVSTVRRKLSSSNSLKDSPRSGRPRLLKGARLKAALALVKGERLTSSHTIAERLKSSEIAVVSSRTMRRHLGQNKMVYGKARKGIQLDEKQKVKRVAFAQHHVQHKTDWKSVMFTDSKIFLKDRLGSRFWYEKGSQPVVQLPLHSIKVHVYFGVTYYGPTKPIFVTCYGSQVSDFTDPKTDQPSKGVNSEEYRSYVLPHMLAEGDRLFKDSPYSNSWVFQQDRASIHTSKASKDYLNAAHPGRWIKDWPSKAADLSWIENTWAWAERKLDEKRPSISTAGELQAAVTDILATLPIGHCTNYARSISRRMERVIEAQGNMI